jgi:hypothetical protein
LVLVVQGRTFVDENELGDDVQAGPSRGEEMAPAQRT